MSLNPAPPSAGSSPSVIGLYWREARWPLLAAGVLAIINGISTVFVLRCVDQILKGSMGNPLGPLAAAAILGFASGATSEIWASRIAGKVVRSEQLSLAEALLRAPLVNVEHSSPSEVVKLIVDDAAAVRRSASSIITLVAGGAAVSAGFVYLAAQSALQTAIVVVGLLFSILPWVVLRGPTVGAHRMLHEAVSRLLRLIERQVHGAKEVRLHAAKRAREAVRTASSLTESMAMQTRLDALSSVRNQLLRVLLVVLIAAALAVGRAFQTMPATELAAFAITVLFLAGPISSILLVMPDLALAGRALGRLRALREQLVVDVEPSLLTGGTPSPVGFRTLTLENIRYAYTGDEGRLFELGPIDFTISPGEIVMIVGGNGSGKSTFTKVLAGLYVPSHGDIEVDGTPIDKGNRDWYRQHFSAIFADYELFDALEDQNPVARAEGQLRRLGLATNELVRAGRFTEARLSTGQSKRVALLGAYLDDRPIYLLDEWAADQDPQFRRAFYVELLPELRRLGKAVVVVSHDDRYFHIADRLIKMEAGRVSGDATAIFMAKLGAN